MQASLSLAVGAPLLVHEIEHDEDIAHHHEDDRTVNYDESDEFLARVHDHNAPPRPAGFGLPGLSFPTEQLVIQDRARCGPGRAGALPRRAAQAPSFLPRPHCLGKVRTAVENLARYRVVTSLPALPGNPTLPMCLAFPWLLQRLGSWWTLGACVLITMACFGAFALVDKRFGITLL